MVNKLPRVIDTKSQMCTKGRQRSSARFRKAFRKASARHSARFYILVSPWEERSGQTPCKTTMENHIFAERGQHFRCIFKVFVRSKTSIRPQIRSEQIVISISLMNLNEVSARAHRSWEELEALGMGFKHGQK